MSEDLEDYINTRITWLKESAIEKLGSEGLKDLEDEVDLDVITDRYDLEYEEKAALFCDSPLWKEYLVNFILEERLSKMAT